MLGYILIKNECSLNASESQQISDPLKLCEKVNYIQPVSLYPNVIKENHNGNYTYSMLHSSISSNVC